MKAIKKIEHGLSPRCVLVLEMLTKGNQTATAMASDILSKVSITDISNKLFSKGLITRRRSKKDRRQVILSITKKGKSIL